METNLKNWILYCTINIENGKIYVGVHKTENPDIFDGYIGCGINIFHKFDKLQTYFHYAVKKYGYNKFKRVVLKKNLTKEEAFKLESIIVNEDFVKSENTYNTSIGGNKGKLSNVLYQFSFDGKLLKEWDSIEVASEYICCSKNGLYNAIHNKTSRKGFYWSFSKQINISEYTNNKSVKIFCYDGDSLKLIEDFETITSASKTLNIKKDLIQRALKCGYKTNGYYFSNIKAEKYTIVKSKSIKNTPIHLYLLDGTYFKILNNKEEIFEFFNIKTLSSIRDAVRSNSVYRGYQISLTKENKLDKAIDKRNYIKKVGRYSLNDELLETFDTVTKARNTYGSGVTKCLKGIIKTTKGFKFKYIS